MSSSNPPNLPNSGSSPLFFFFFSCSMTWHLGKDQEHTLFFFILQLRKIHAKTQSEKREKIVIKYLNCMLLYILP